MISHYYIEVCLISKIFEYFIILRFYRGYWINRHPQLYKNKPITDKNLSIILCGLTFIIPLTGILFAYLECGKNSWRRERKVIQLRFVDRMADLVVYPPELNKENRTSFNELTYLAEYQIPHTPRIEKALRGDFLPRKRA